MASRIWSTLVCACVLVLGLRRTHVGLVCTLVCAHVRSCWACAAHVGPVWACPLRLSLSAPVSVRTRLRPSSSMPALVCAHPLFPTLSVPVLIRAHPLLPSPSALVCALVRTRLCPCALLALAHVGPVCARLGARPRPRSCVRA
jgi:hypothetical protein